ESELEVAALAPEIGMEPIGRAGEYGRAQDKELPVGEMRQQCIDAILHHLANGIEELVDRRADGDDKRHSWRNIRRRGGEYEPVLLERPHEQLFAAVFDERQAARSQRLERVPVWVVHVHAGTRLGECEHERNANVTGAADDRQIGGIEPRGHCRSRFGTGDIHANAPRIVAKRRSQQPRRLIAQPSAQYKGFTPLALAIKARVEPAAASPTCRDNLSPAAWAQARRQCATRKCRRNPADRKRADFPRPPEWRFPAYICRS